MKKSVVSILFLSVLSLYFLVGGEDDEGLVNDTTEEVSFVTETEAIQTKPSSIVKNKSLKIVAPPKQTNERHGDVLSKRINQSKEQEVEDPLEGIEFTLETLEQVDCKTCFIDALYYSGRFSVDERLEFIESVLSSRIEFDPEKMNEMLKDLLENNVNFNGAQVEKILSIYEQTMTEKTKVDDSEMLRIAMKAMDNLESKEEQESTKRYLSSVFPEYENQIWGE